MMNQPGPSIAAASFSNLRLLAFAPAIVCALILIAPCATQAQNFTVLYSFTGGIDLELPGTGVTLDSAGNLYGGTQGRNNGGGIYELMRHGSTWIFKPLYNFQQYTYDGTDPNSDLVFGPDGALYGTTRFGGNWCDDARSFCGTVFSLRPPANSCGNAVCFWNETPVYRFGENNINGTDGFHPNGPLVFDSAGNIYSTTNGGGLNNAGTAFELSRTQNGWKETIIDNFVFGLGAPTYGLTFDAGKLYGGVGEAGYSRIFELVQTSQGWNEQTIYSFPGSNTNLEAGLIFDAAGNAYGATEGNYDYQSGTVYQLTPQAGGTWSETTLYVFPLNIYGPANNLTMDAAGNLYGTTPGTPGDNNDKYGMVFVLSPSNGSWTFTQLYQFTDGLDGAYPSGGVTLDAAGNLYGACVEGGASGAGTVWEITR